VSARPPKLTINDLLKARLLVNSGMMSLSRDSLFGASLDPDGRNLDKECGYPQGEPSVDLYRKLYDREGLATRVVNVYPDECWSVQPLLYETEDSRITKFERAWNSLCKMPELNPWGKLHLVDELSGIGSFGALLIGINDGKDLSEPADGIDSFGKPTNARPTDRELIYLMPFSSDLVRIDEFETNKNNPRFGQPLYYSVLFADPKDATAGQLGPVAVQTGQWDRVHWSRMQHVADNAKSSRVFGTPRLRPVLNRMFDVRKVAGGSAEMFWRGAFPGYSFETFPELGAEVELEVDSLKKQFDAYSNGLQRYLALTGMTAKSLAPQVADPTKTLTQLLILVCSAISVPMRIFLGSEAGHLASTQDSGTWNKRVARRQTMYLNPMLIMPFVTRLIYLGVLPEPKNLIIAWKDLNSLSDKDHADIALKKAQAILQYVTSGSHVLVPPKEFMVLVLGWTTDEADAVIAAAGGTDKVVQYLKEQVSSSVGQTPATSGTNPDKQTGAGGRRNALGNP
jgi:hypothetical protein